MRKLIVFVGILVLGISFTLMADTNTNQYGTASATTSGDCSVTITVSIAGAYQDPNAEIWFCTTYNDSVGGSTIGLGNGISFFALPGDAPRDLGDFGITLNYFNKGIGFSVTVPASHGGTALATPGDKYEIVVEDLDADPIFFLTVNACPAGGGDEERVRMPASRLQGTGYSASDDGTALTVFYKNIGDANGMIYQLFVGPGLHETAQDNYWMPDSDLWTVILLGEVITVGPGQTVGITIPYPAIPDEDLQTAIDRSTNWWTGNTFGYPPHLAVGADPAAWCHITEGWLEWLSD